MRARMGIGREMHQAAPSGRDEAARSVGIAGASQAAPSVASRHLPRERGRIRGDGVPDELGSELLESRGLGSSPAQRGRCRGAAEGAGGTALKRRPLDNAPLCAAAHLLRERGTINGKAEPVISSVRGAELYRAGFFSANFDGKCTGAPSVASRRRPR